MKYYPNKGYRTRVKKVLSVFIIVFLCLASYLSVPLFMIQEIFEEPMIKEVDDANFIPADLNQMSTMADELEFYLNEYHLPLNYTLSVYWNEDFSEIERYIVTGDACVWTGMMLGAQSFRYAAAKNANDEIEMNEALTMVRKVLSGVSLLLAVPNGGIGPEYSGVLARSVVSSEVDRSKYSAYEDPNPLDVFSGAGSYSDWLWIGYPSIDQNSGIVFGLTKAAVLVAPDHEDIALTTALLTQQLVEHYLRTNWMIMDANGRTTGQDIDISTEQGAFTVLSFLKMAVLANPNNQRYRDLYYHYAYERGYINSLKPIVPIWFYNYFNYYSLSLFMLLLYNLVEMESDPFLKERYLTFYEKNFYNTYKNSRNAWLNVAYLGITGRRDSFISRDIADQLMRFGLEDEPGHTRIPDRGGGRTPIPEENYGTDSLIKWHEFTSNNIIGRTLYGWMGNLLPDVDSILNTPKTTDQYPQEDFIWQRSPWTPGHRWYNEEYREDSGLAYLLPYYAGMFYNIWEE